MTLIVPGGSENTITDTYLKQFWSESCGFTGCTEFRLKDSNYPVTVEQVAQAGFGAAGVEGLVIGAIYSTTKKSKMEK